MDYQYLVKLKQHPTLRLLNAESFPLIISFFHQTYIEPNVRVLSQSEIVEKLDDYLFQLRQAYGETLHPRTAREYLDQWASGESAYLRKYYPPQGDEPEFDLTPATEKAIEWLRSLVQKQFIGTESRLLTIFQLLQAIVQATETDQEARINVLEKQKQAIDDEINRLKSGDVAPQNPTQIKERFYQVEDTARQLLSDFRQVEENFRQLDRKTRERIATSSLNKGALLDEIFGEQDAIADSDQGRSFRGFWSFLVSPARQQEFNELLQKVLTVDLVQELRPDAFLLRYKYHLLEAGEKVQRTSATLIEQLRKYLDDQAWLDNKRIMHVIQDIEKKAIHMRQMSPKDKVFMQISEIKPSIELPMSRGLFLPSRNPVIAMQEIINGASEANTDVLYNQHYVDEQQLRGYIRQLLQEKPQVTLPELCQRFPLKKGLNELIVYLNIASNDSKSMIDNEHRILMTWQTEQGQVKKVTMPLLIFTR